MLRAEILLVHYAIDFNVLKIQSFEPRAVGRGSFFTEL